MIDVMLMAVGGLLLGWTIVVYCLDCHGRPSSTMGGDMLFSAYWSVASIVFALGLLPTINHSRWWAIPASVVLYAVSFPLRHLISRLACAPDSPAPTGFQEFVRRTEARRKRQQGAPSRHRQPNESPPSAHGG